MTGNQPRLFEELDHRLGRDHLAKRLRLQVDHSARFFGQGFGGFHWENSRLIPAVLEMLLRALRLLRVGKRNALDFEIVEVDVMLENLPEAFEGFCFLQLSDIHIDGMPDRGERLIRIIKKLRFDVCVLTGDYRFHTFGDHDRCLTGMKRLAASLECPDGIYGISATMIFWKWCLNSKRAVFACCSTKPSAWCAGALSFISWGWTTLTSMVLPPWREPTATFRRTN